MTHRVRKNIPFGVVVEPAGSNFAIENIDAEWLRMLFRNEQLIVLRGFETFSEQESFARWCERFGEIALWPFGKVLNLQERPDPEDHIFDNSCVPLHWDGMYRRQVPEYQIFHCVHAPALGAGGCTTFSNTTSALENASSDLLELWGKITGVYERSMEFYTSRTVSPVISRHPFRDIPVIRYNEPHREEKGRFINPPKLHFSGIPERDLNHFHNTLHAALYHPRNFYSHAWQPNDVVIADNFSLLHGRSNFVSKTPRQLWRVHVHSSPAFNNPCLEWQL
ncbi:MAG: TauD/TfdA family dioxygenase [Proteobacteria bacterium]|nr:TauD/TfdA family dioxygenase [Pseudomonadota bacterium]